MSDFLRAEPVPVFASPALGKYHPEVRSLADVIEDAALVAGAYTRSHFCST